MRDGDRLRLFQCSVRAHAFHEHSVQPRSGNSDRATVTGTAQDIRLEHVNFESVEVGASDAFVVIQESPDTDVPSRIFFDHVRFGAEAEHTVNGVRYDKPKHDVRVGNPSAPGVGMNTEIVFDTCEFLGRGSGRPHTASADSAIAFYSRPLNNAIVGYNIFRSYHTALIAEPWSEAANGRTTNIVYPFSFQGRG